MQTPQTDIFTDILKRIDGRLDRFETKFDRIDTDIQDIKISLARIEEQGKAIDKRIGLLETRDNAQETRFWGLVGLLTTSLVGIIAKLLFFPSDRLP